MIIAGGYFQKGMRLKDYWSKLSDDETFVVHDVFFDILDHLDDERYFVKNDIFTFRGLAELKAAIHSEIDNKDYSYLDFYEV